MEAQIKKEEVDVPDVGKFNVYIQGSRSSNEVVVLTVHDLGCSHETYLDMLATPAMETLAKRCVWVHIDIPGQGDDEEELPTDYVFPTINNLSGAIIHILEKLNIKHVVLFGEGAGANILARFAMGHDERVLGAVLVSISGATHRFDKLKSWLMSNPISVSNQVESYLSSHRFGDVDMKNDKDGKNNVHNFIDSVKSHRNPKNLSKYINAYLNRESIANKIAKIRCPVLFMTAGKASSAHSTHTLYENLMKALRSEPERRTKVELVVVERSHNIFCDAPDKVAQSFQYFIQGLGLAGSLGDRKRSGSGRAPPLRNRTLSMEEYDKPRGAENVVYNPRRKYSSTCSNELPATTEAD